MNQNTETTEVLIEALDITPSQPASVALTVTERAALAVGTAAHEIKLAELVKTAKTITAITNKDGYTEAHATRMTLKNTRLAITSTSKEAREDAQKFSKAVIAEEARLIAIIKPEEDRINTLQEAWDAQIEAEKQRKIDEERARVQGIKDAIGAIQRYPLDAVGKSSEAIKAFIESCADVVVTEEIFAEHTAFAAMAKADALTALAALKDTAIAQEAEQERVRLERIELEALREKARLDEIEREKAERIRAEENANRLRTERLESERKAREAQDALKKQQDESARLTQELAELRAANEKRIADEQQAIKDREAAEQKAESDRLEAEEQDRMAEANSQAQLVAQQDDEARAEARIEETSAPALAEVVLCPVADEVEAESYRPTDTEIVNVVADFFDVDAATAWNWITSVTNLPEQERLAA